MDRVIDAFIQLRIDYQQHKFLMLTVDEFSRVLGLSKSTTIECLNEMVSRQYLLKTYWRTGCKGRPRNVYKWGVAGDILFNNWLNETKRSSLGDYILELYAKSFSARRSRKSSISFQVRLLLTDLFKLVCGGGFISGYSLDDLGKISGMGVSRVRYALRDLENDNIVKIFKGHSSSSIFDRSVNLYCIDLVHPFFSIVRKQILYRYESRVLTLANEYHEAFAIQQAALMIIEAKVKRGNRRLQKHSRSEVDYHSVVDVQVGFLQNVVPLVDIDFEPLACFFQNEGSTSYLQVKLHLYVSCFLSDHWEEVESDDDVAEIKNLICRDVSIRHFEHLFDKNEASQILENLVRFLYQVTLGLARKVREILLKTKNHFEDSQYLLVPPSRFRKQDSVRFEVLTITKNASTQRRVDIIQTDIDKYMVKKYTS